MVLMPLRCFAAQGEHNPTYEGVKRIYRVIFMLSTSCVNCVQEGCVCVLMLCETFFSSHDRQHAHNMCLMCSQRSPDDVRGNTGHVHLGAIHIHIIAHVSHVWHILHIVLRVLPSAETYTSTVC